MNLQELKENARKSGIRQDVKSHCTKIRDGINKNGSTSGNRAIWELFQNAGDLAKNGSAEIMITLTNDAFVFAHKGKPFTYDSLCSLVKQVSSEEKENDDAVGQYGTGFLTTHKFSRKITINGSMLICNDPEVYVDVTDFVIDRTNFDDITLFIEDMTNQIMAVEKLFDGDQKTEAREWTTLRYELNDERKVIAQTAIDEAMKLMPYVLTFNDKIVRCTIDDQTRNKKFTFEKVDKTTSENGLFCKSIMISGNDEEPTPFDCYYLECHEGMSRIILPLETETRVRSLAGVPKLFVHFPLIPQVEQNYFDVNFLFHSHMFKPEEPRDNIIVPRENDATEKAANANNIVLEEMTSVLWRFLEKNVHTWTNTIEMASIDITCTGFNDAKTESYYKTLKEKWVDEFSKLKLMDIDGTKYSMSGESHPVVLDSELCCFLSSDKEHDYLSVVYPYAKGVAKIPSKEELLKWSLIISGWNSCLTTNFLNLETIVDYVSKNKDGQLHKMLTMIVDANHSEFFDKFALLPNREGVLMKREDLRDAASITRDLYQLVKNLDSSICTKMVDEDYADVIKLTEYDRKNLRDELNAIVKKNEDECWKEPKSQPYSGDFEKNLIALCSCYNTLDGASARKRLMPIICRFEGVDYEARVISASADETPGFDLYRQIFLSLVENQMMKISVKDDQWVSENYEDLVAFVGNALGEDYKGFCFRYAIYPDMNNGLHKPDELKKCCVLDEKLFGFYNSVVGEDLKSKCVATEFETFFDKYNDDTCQYTEEKVANEIKEKLSGEKYKNTVVLDIIELTESNTEDGKKWHDLFKDIYDQRQSIRYNLGTPEEHQAVNIMLKQNNPGLLQKMAEVAERGDAFDIINSLEDTLERKKNDEYRNMLGTYVEDHIQRFLQEALKDYGINVTNEQNGQDLILSKEGYDIYHIEVKSRWSSSQSVEMTQLQFHCAVDHPERYALMNVNMYHFDRTRAENGEMLQLSELYPNIKCLDNIGVLEKDLSDRTCKAFNGGMDDIRLDGYYKVIVPQSVFDCHSLDFNGMVDRIKTKFN